MAISILSMVYAAGVETWRLRVAQGGGSAPSILWQVGHAGCGLAAAPCFWFRG